MMGNDGDMSSKVNRQAAITAQLTDIMSELSGYSESELPSSGTFLALGFDSLFLTQLATAFQKEFAIDITFRQLITEQSTPDALAEWLAEQKPATDADPRPDLVSDAAAPEVADQAERNAEAPVATMGNHNTSELKGVFARQLDLMRAQLTILRDSGAAGQPGPVQQIAVAMEKAPAQEASGDTQPAAPFCGTGPQITPSSDTYQCTEAQRGHIERLTARYNAKTQQSKDHAAADRVRHADPRTAAGFNQRWKELVYPLVVNRSQGAYLWDVDGNRYIDLLNGFGPNFFGHRAPFVTDALKAQLDDGFEIGPQTPQAGEAATLLCELTGMDRASWVNTGSEAVQAAIRIARTVTGRDKIVVFKGSYHGNFDEVLVRGVPGSTGNGRTLPLAPGIPFGSVGNVIVLDYGEDTALQAITENSDDIAAVLVEPVQSRRPDFQPRAFLHSLRALTEKRGIALVFDEVITGFRTGPGGAQDYFGVKADLATYGKILGGGMPIGAIAGDTRFMDTFDGGAWRYGDASKPEAGVTFFAGTFVRHPLAIAAAHASLKHLKEEGPALQEKVTARAARFADELNAFFEERSVGFRVLQFASQMFIRVDEETPLTALFFYHMRDRGVHLLEGFPCYMTAAHTDADVTAAIDAAKDAIREMQADGVLPGGADTDSGSNCATEKLALTPGQQVIWSTSQISDLASCAFNESDSFYIDGALDRGTFTSAVNETFAAHEAFRLRFESAGAGMFVADGPGFSLEFQDVSDLPADDQHAHIRDWIRDTATTPFDLECGPLGCARLFRLDADRHQFVIFAHHLIFDGYSSDLLIRDIVRRYGAAVSGARPASSDIEPYSAYCQKAHGDILVPDYWKEVFANGAPPSLDMPTDALRGDIFSYRGATARRTLPASLCGDVRAAARALGVTMSTVTMSAYAAMLASVSGRPEFIVALPAAGQARHDIEAIGYCVNVLPIPVKVADVQTFEQLATAVQDKTLDAFENQDLSLSALMAHINATRSPNDRPLIEAMFNYGGYFKGLDVAGINIRAAENERHAVCNELFLNVSDHGDVLHLDLEYAADLFAPTTIETWLDKFSDILRSVADDPSASLTALSLQSGEMQPNVVLFEAHRVRHGNDACSEMLNATERAVVDAVGALLARDEISIDANFFELGGHSIHASRLLTGLRKSIAPSLGIRAIFEADTLKTLAAHIDSFDGAEGAEREEFVF